MPSFFIAFVSIRVHVLSMIICVEFGKVGKFGRIAWKRKVFLLCPFKQSLTKYLTEDSTLWN